LKRKKPRGLTIGISDNLAVFGLYAAEKSDLAIFLRKIIILVPMAQAPPPPPSYNKAIFQRLIVRFA
jgi:hypothetical protein